MRNIDDLLAAATRLRGSWSTERARRLLDLLAASLAHAHARVDWDAGVPENWGRVLSDRALWADVGITTPLVMVTQDVAGRLADPLASEPVVTLVVSSWDAAELEADRDVLAAAFPDSRHIILRDEPGLPDWSAFSANDLWWATVT